MKPYPPPFLFPALLLLLVSPATAPAQTTIVDLPLLVGEYDAGFVLPNDQPDRRSCTFIMPPEVATIDMMHLIMSGSGTDGRYVVERSVGGIVVTDTLDVPCTMMLLLTADTLDGAQLLSGAELPENVIVDFLGGFTHSEDAALLDFNLLLGTPIGAELICRFDVTAGHLVDPLGIVTDIHLRLQGQTVPAAEHTWGGVKALFR